MARMSSRNTTLMILDADSASRNISGRANTATMNFTSEELDVTAFGAEYRERIADALKDWSLEFGGFWDGSASQIDEVLYNLLAACTSVCYGPAGSTSGYVQYSGCAILQDYTVESAVEGAVAFSATFMSASVLTRGTWG